MPPKRKPKPKKQAPPPPAVAASSIASFQTSEIGSSSSYPQPRSPSSSLSPAPPSITSEIDRLLSPSPEPPTPQLSEEQARKLRRAEKNRARCRAYRQTEAGQQAEERKKIGNFMRKELAEAKGDLEAAMAAGGSSGRGNLVAKAEAALAEAQANLDEFIRQKEERIHKKAGFGTGAGGGEGAGDDEDVGISLGRRTKQQRQQKQYRMQKIAGYLGASDGGRRGRAQRG